MTGVGNQSQRVGKQAEEPFDYDKAQIESHADRKSAIVSAGRIQVTNAASRMAEIAMMDVGGVLMHQKLRKGELLLPGFRVVR